MKRSLGRFAVTLNGETVATGAELVAELPGPAMDAEAMGAPHRHTIAGTVTHYTRWPIPPGPPPRNRHELRRAMSRKANKRMNRHAR